MTPVRILGTKIGNNANKFFNINIPKYMHALTREAKKSPGYIKSKNYYECSNDYTQGLLIGNIYNISDWESLYDWEFWHKSTERSLIQQKFQHTIIKEDFRMLYVKGGDSIFLL